MGEVIFTQVNDENETTTYEKEIVAILLPDFVLNFRYSLLVLENWIEQFRSIQTCPKLSKVHIL